MKVVFTPLAQADLMDQLLWLEHRSPKAARRAADVIHDRLLFLAEFPFAAPALDDHHREATVRFGRDGFVLWYRLEDSTLYVVRIFKGGQNRASRGK